MKESGLAPSTLSFNGIMSLYTNNNSSEEVINVFTQMKESGRTPDNWSYRFCINAYGQNSEIEGIEKIFEEMESRADLVIGWSTYTMAANIYIKAGLNHKARNALLKAEARLDEKNAEGYNYLISRHAKLGNKMDVFRIWDIKIGAHKRRGNEDYMYMLASLVKLGELEGMEKIFEEMESRADLVISWSTYTMAANTYIKAGLNHKARNALLKAEKRLDGQDVDCYNYLISLHAKLGNNMDVFRIWELKKRACKSCVHNDYIVMLASLAKLGEFEEMERIFEEMESRTDFVIDWNICTMAAKFYIKAGLNYKARNALLKAEERLDGKMAGGYNYLISLHAKIGNKTDVFRIWELEKRACKRCFNKYYIVMLESLVKLGELEEAEKLLVDWESSGNFHDVRVPEVIILGYIEKGLFEKAERILEDLVEKGKETKPDSWAKLVDVYLDNGELKNAVRCMKAALSICKISGSWKPHLKMIMRILESVTKEGNIEDLQMLINSLRKVLPLNLQSYHALLEYCIRNGKQVDVVLENMRVDKIIQDEETKLILSKKG